MKSKLKRLLGSREKTSSPSDSPVHLTQSKKIESLAPKSEIPPKNSYALRFVHGEVNESTAKEIINLWSLNQALLNEEEAKRRISEVACIARNASGEVVAVNSIYLREVPNAGGQFYFYRQFTRPQDRCIALSLSMLRQTLAFLKSRELEQPPSPQSVQGVILIAENAKLSRKGMHRLLQRSGLTLVARESRGLNVWGLRFRD